MIDGVITKLDSEEIAEKIIFLYENEMVRNKLSKNCKSKSYENKYELEKLYNAINL